MHSRMIFTGLSCLFALMASTAFGADAPTRERVSFDKDWRFFFGDESGIEKPDYADAQWRKLDVPHDWMIEGQAGKDPSTMEGPFDRRSPGGNGNGCLNGGTGWYRKSFTLPASAKGKHVTIQFDGVYMDADVWLNGEHLGNHPYGYTSFEYDLTKFVKTDGPNLLAVRTKVEQPCSRFYSGAGIYRHVWLTMTEPLHVSHWGTFVTSKVTGKNATITARTSVSNDGDQPKTVVVGSAIVGADGKQVAQGDAAAMTIEPGKSQEVEQTLEVADAQLWSIEKPTLYHLVSTVKESGNAVDGYETPFGIRTIEFTVDNGFLLNGQRVPIQGVCDHHDIGCLGSAVNTRAIERQLEILRSFGVNAIRTSHNPPAPELLDLCDRMGFVVMDEAFDEWKSSKTRYGYGRFFDEWSEPDIMSLLHRDRNHPSVVLWSIGNEIREQGARNGQAMSQRLSDICHREDPTRGTTSAMSSPEAAIRSGFSKPLDVFGVNYHPTFYESDTVHGKVAMIGSETSSAVSSRGEYGLSLSEGKVATTQLSHSQVTSYDTYHPRWATTAETDLMAVQKAKWLAGEFVWTGFDYIGEPTPFPWPARSSYFGIVDLCGFPKDRYFLYQSQWTDKPMVHLLPHWNWEGFEGKEIPVWCFTNADSVELFLNDKSLGEHSMKADAKNIHLEWSVAYQPGVLKAVAKKDGKTVATDVVTTAGKPAKIVLTPDRAEIAAGVRDLVFVTVSVVDKDGILCPNANDEMTYKVEGPGRVVGVDDGDATNHESFQGTQHRVFHGLGLVVIEGKEAGQIHLTATGDGLEQAEARTTTR